METQRISQLETSSYQDRHVTVLVTQCHFVRYDERLTERIEAPEERRKKGPAVDTCTPHNPPYLVLRGVVLAAGQEVGVAPCRRELQSAFQASMGFFD